MELPAQPQRTNQAGERTKRNRNCRKPRQKDRDGRIKGQKNADRAKAVKAKALEKHEETKTFPPFVVLKDELINLSNVTKQQQSQ